MDPILCNIGFMGLFLEPGKHVIDLFYKPPYLGLSLVASLVGILVYFIIIGLKYRYEKNIRN